MVVLYFRAKRNFFSNPLMHGCETATWQTSGCVRFTPGICQLYSEWLMVHKRARFVAGLLSMSSRLCDCSSYIAPQRLLNNTTDHIRCDGTQGPAQVTVTGVVEHA